jgi:ATP-dependent helicase/nuclease subunit A
LEAELLRLDITPTAKNMDLARSLFGTVLDLPGGINIGTIHSFCQSMLRRFPLEAQVSPHFSIEDEVTAAQRRRRAKDMVLTADDLAGAVSALAAEQNDDQFTKAIAGLLSDPEALVLGLKEYGLEGLVGRQREALGVGHLTMEQIWQTGVRPPKEAAIRGSLDIIMAKGSDKAREIVSPGLNWLELDHEARRARFSEWCSVFLKADGDPRAGNNLAGKKVVEAHPTVLDAIHEEQARLVGFEQTKIALTFAASSEALVRLVAPILEVEEKAKASSGTLDYADLILKTAGLLVDPGAAWVMYKMDGGIDHILVDEVQDVSPAQWRIIWSLLGDFFSGDGARQGKRTIFAVGDVKQSIFSFQGADLHSFIHFQQRLNVLVEQAGQRWVDGELNTSFRSTAGVLDVVDAVFEDPAAQRGVTFDHGQIRHQVSRIGQAGSVTLWPLVPEPEPLEVPEWAAADAYELKSSHLQRLAYGVASWLKGAIGNFPLESRGRALRAGDVLVLVRNRNEFGETLVPALKEAGIAVAGLDRITLADSRAVADLIAFAEAVTLPQNDLAMGTFLCSPLGGLTDESFMELALGRDGSLSGALFARGQERDDWREALNLYMTMQSRVDFVSPFRFFSELLGKHGGRQMLLRRLGPDALEPLDEFLAAALRYNTQQTPTLRGFLHAVETSDAEIKRETDVTADAVRIMTVHGAKGLQAPLVIMPDTLKKPSVRDNLFWKPGSDQGPAVPILCPRGGKNVPVIAAEMARVLEQETEEHNRLLYVAMTRAEDHLIVCGGTPDGDDAPEESWYAAVKRGLQRVGAMEFETPGLDWPGSALAYRTAQGRPGDRQQAVVTNAAAAQLPAWMGSGPDYVPVPPAADPNEIERIVPSRVGDDGPTQIRAGRPVFGAGKGRAAAIQRGTLIHALLQYLPSAPGDEAEEFAHEYLSDRGLDATQAAEVIAEVFGVWRNEQIAEVFSVGAQAEVPIAGIVDGAEVAGVIDRLFIGPDKIIFVDFKSDARPPAKADDVPAGYRKQVEAYGRVLEAAYPGREIQGHLVWTASGAVMSVFDRVPA